MVHVAATVSKQHQLHYHLLKSMAPAVAASGLPVIAISFSMQWRFLFA
jgi:hypothetical protein